MNLPVHEALRVLKAQEVGVLPPFLDCTIDTRSLKPGQTYLALRGDRFDGHEFIAQAQAQGAVAAIVDDVAALSPGLPGLVVADTHKALMTLAALARRHFCGAVVAITGSAGKTTTRVFVSQIISKVLGTPIAASPANENNEIGVSKVLLALTNEATAVIEMGARHFGDIAPLVAIARPHISILTNIGEAHIEIFQTRERLAQTKWQIFSAGSCPLVCAADPISMSRLESLEETPILYGLHSDRPVVMPQRSWKYAVWLDGNELQLEWPNKPLQSLALSCNLPGEHNLRNLAAACAAAIALELPIERVAEAASHVTLPPGRYERRVSVQGAVIIHDAYNASPSGTLASLAAFAQEPGNRRIVVLGSMAELGVSARDEHRRVGVGIAAVKPHLVFVGGLHAQDLAEGARSAGIAIGCIQQFTTNAELLESLHVVLKLGDSVLVKGSRMYRLDEVIEALTATSCAEYQA